VAVPLALDIADDRAEGGGSHAVEPSVSSSCGSPANENHYPARRPPAEPAPASTLYEEFHPFGTTSYAANDSGIEVSAKRYRYIGKERDEETGLYHLGARYYASWLGRWTGGDPIGISGGIDLYAYAASNPVKFVDPSGRAPQLVTEQYTIPYEKPDQGPSEIVFEDEIVKGNLPSEVGFSYGQYTAVLKRTEGVAVERAPGALGAAEALGTFAEGTIDAFTPRLESRPGDKIPNIIGVVQEGLELVAGTRQAAEALADAQADIEIAEVTGDAAAANEARKERGRSGVFFGFGVASIFGAGRQAAGSIGRPRAHIAGDGGGGSGPRGLLPGEAGRFGDLDKRAVVGDGLTPHHMPQAAAGFTSRGEGGALVLAHPEHVQTRTYGSRGRATARAEKGLSFRDVLARDIRDVRRQFGDKYDEGLRQLTRYYRENFPDLMKRTK